ncbi:MAG TPA: bacteriohemerythrin [Chroococcidiopsis sp.]
MGVTIARWRPEYETGDALVDQQHQSLFSTINALNNAMLEGQGEALLEKTLQSLTDYTTVHFDTEEQFMRLHQYPGYADHKLKHEALKAAVVEFEQKNHQDLRQLTSAVSHFLTDWLIHHIKDEDQKMIAFCCQGQQAKSKSAESWPTEDSATGGLIAPWRSEYETGYTLIDDQHRSLFHAINALHSAMLAGRAEELLDRTLKSLRNYTTIHFETEEQFMLKYGYPGYLEHKSNHEMLREQVEQFSHQEKSQNTSQIIITVSHFLTNWLIHHIKDEDQKMINFLRTERQKEQEKKDAAANSAES